MSADNWARCPRCVAKAKREYEERAAGVSSLYGRVQVEDFDKARAELGEYEDPEPTFREDYEIYGAEQGEIEVHYKGRCSICGLSAEINHSKVIFDVAAVSGGGDQ